MSKDKNRPENIQSSAKFKVLGDPKRMAILQLLMAQPATLSQLGRALGDHPAKIRHHLKQLERADLVTLSATNIVGGFVEKYYAASAPAYLVNLAILPRSTFADTLCLMGSHDLALILLSQMLKESKHPVDLAAISIGSLDGLIALRQGICQLSGSHLPDGSAGQFNQGYVQRLFPTEPVTMITLAHREQGLLVQEGNPLGIRDLADLGRQDIKLINRQPGSGTRIWLDQNIASEGLSAGAIPGYSNDVSSHLEVAQFVASGRAAAGIGLRAASRQYSSDFIPLFTERFDLVLRSETMNLPAVQILLEQINSTDFRRQVETFGGYDTSSTGDVREINNHANKP